MIRNSIKLGTFKGTEIGLDLSWILIFAWVTWSLATLGASFLGQLIAYAFIGWFLLNAAASSWQQAAIQDVLKTRSELGL